TDDEPRSSGAKETAGCTRHGYSPSLRLISQASHDPPLLVKSEYHSSMTDVSGGLAGSEFLSGQDSLDHHTGGLVCRLPREFQVDNTFLRWDRRPTADVLVRPGPKMLDGFVRLADSSPDQILAYAQEWGPLWLCEHGLHWRLCGPGCYPRTDPDAGEWWSW